MLKNIQHSTQDFSYYGMALLIGTVGGLVGSVFHLSLEAIFKAYDRFFSGLASHWEAIVLAALLSASMAVLSVWLVRRFAPEAAGSGIQEIEGAMEGKRPVHWLRVLWVKFFGGLLALGSGLVLGREGPTIHMGAVVAKGLSAPMRLCETKQRGLLAAGAGAGLAAAFNAPLAAIAFVTEEMQSQFPFRINTYIALFLAAISSGIVTEVLTGRNALIAIDVPPMPFSIYPLLVVLGCIAGLLGVVFNRLLLSALDFVYALPKRLWWCPALLLGAVSGVLLMVFPDAVRGGEHLVLNLSVSHLGLGALILLVLLRFAGSIFSYAGGTPGGIFAPMLAIAASFGLAVGVLANELVPIVGLENACAVVAMGALFTASVRAPVVGVILVLELTGSYTLLLPLMVGCACASVVAQALGGKPIYSLLLERTLRIAEAEKRKA